MRLVFIDSLNHAKSIDTNYAIIRKISCLAFRFSLKICSLKLFLDDLSDFHQILHTFRPCQQKVWDFMLIKMSLFIAAVGVMPAAMLSSLFWQNLKDETYFLLISYLWPFIVANCKYATFSVDVSQFVTIEWKTERLKQKKWKEEQPWAATE